MRKQQMLRLKKQNKYLIALAQSTTVTPHFHCCTLYCDTVVVYNVMGGLTTARMACYVVCVCICVLF